MHRILAMLFICIPALSLAQEVEDFKIEKYRFSWLVAEVGESAVTLNKENGGKIFVEITSDAAIRLTPTEAAEVGKILADTENQLKAVAQLIVERRIKTGGVKVVDTSSSGITVTFNIPRDGRPNSIVRNGKSSAKMDRATALKFGKALADVVEMAAFLDTKIRP